MNTTGIERKLQSYKDIAKIFTERGDLDVAKAACDLGLELNPVCGVLKFFKGLVCYKGGRHDKSTQFFTDIICGNSEICDTETKILFEKHQIPFDEVFMESLREVYSKIQNQKVLITLFLLTVTIILTIFCVKTWG